MAGDYEYFAAQGRPPFAFALAELVDNALAATWAAAARGAARVEVTLATNAACTAGLVCVADNGVGMGTRDLNEWAVMNLAVAERGGRGPHGDAPPPPPAPNALAVARHLTGSLSHFGVGSKNAAFFLGRWVKVASKRAGDAYVHELALDADALEARWRDPGAGEVYEEDVVHRAVGDGSTLGEAEAGGPFGGLARAWVAAEVRGGVQGPGSCEPACRDDGKHCSPVLYGEEDAAGAAVDPVGAHFTRVVVGALKPAALAALAADRKGERTAAALAHLYHYYLHGPAGRGGGGGGGGGGTSGGDEDAANPRALPPPAITLRGVVGSKTVWTRDLADVDDDPESAHLAAAAATFEFSLRVPGRDDVSGVAWYFPHDGVGETLPDLAGGAAADPISTFDLTQADGPSARPTAGGGTQAAAGDDDDDDAPPLARAPAFEAFWQGRLIPGARVDSLPFIEAVRGRRGAAARDALPDAAFARVRGALFLGPRFEVTRNKLTFRDDLQQARDG